jgi:hypothetical protein
MKIPDKSFLPKQVTLLVSCIALGVSGCSFFSNSKPPACLIETPEGRGTALYQFNFDAQGMPQPDTDGIIKPLTHFIISDGTRVELVADKPKLSLPKEKLPSNIPGNAFNKNGQFVTQLVEVTDGPNSNQTGWANSQYLSCP